MAGKRTAQSDLNHDNWDREDDVEEAGTFQKASEDVLKRRVIKTARRRNTELNVGNGEETTKKTIFGGFTGFSSFAPPNPNAAFNFLNNSNKTTIPSPAVTNTSKPSVSSSIFSSSLTNGVEKTEKLSTTSKTPNTITTIFDKKAEKIPLVSTLDKNENSDDDRSEYYAKLKGLNESVLSWIEKHVKENPFINLKPIFIDYERYLTDLEVKHVTVSSETKKELVGFSFKSSPTKTDNNKTETTSPKITFGVPTEKKTEDKVDKLSFGSSTAPNLFGNKTSDKFTFGAPSATTKDNDEKKDTPASGSFVFGSANAAKSSTVFGASGANSLFGSKSSVASTPFGFGSGVPSFGKPAPPTETIDLNADDDEDEPPKVEFTKVVEQDHIYTIRCKVFVKKDGTFGDRGVGNMYLKKVPDSEKVQLIVRADTNLGNLLCNLILSEAVPTQRMGKKDVMLVCIPMPDEKPPPVPMLLRVKNEQEADTLLKELEKHKK